jgi:hypothetical protein
MSTPRIGILPQEERMAIIQGAKRLGLHPYEFGGFLSLESGRNMDPNIVGGAGGRHKGLIQFGPAEQQKYLKPGTQTRAGQMPAVLQYFQDRGYKPGMGIERAYATVLGGNPNVSLEAKDSFGTSVAGAAKRFKQGGDLYENARRVLGDIPTEYLTVPEAQAQGAGKGQETSSAGFLQGFLSAMEGNKPKDLSVTDLLKQELMGQLLAPKQSSAMNPFELLLQTGNPYG